MNKSIYILFIGILILFSSCRKDFDTVPSSGKLEFSKNKIYLDTVFTNIGSSTYSLKVYNRSNKDISIPVVQLAKGLNSKYRMMVDGMTGNGKIFNNVELLAKDSLYIFIETTANIADTEPDFTYNDKILFDLGSNQQSVDLATLIQDANFIFPNRALATDPKEILNVIGLQGLEGHTLTDSELHWTNAKPYVIYGYAAVPAGKTLIIDKGTRVYFHAESGLIIDDTATLNINGEVNIFDADGKIITQNEVTFEGDRLEPDFEDVPGQWGTVLIFSGASNNINHLTLKNSTVGLFMQRNVVATTPNLYITNSQFYGCSSFGILARNSTITGKNLVINSAGQANLYCSQGGNYDFTHCTFNNNWSSSKQVSVLLDDYVTDNNGVFAGSFPLNSNFKNCIIYGSNRVQLLLDKKGTVFNTNFDHCLVQFKDENTTLVSNTLYDLIRNQQNGNIKNQDPKFKNIKKNQLNILTGSAAINKGNAIYSTFSDILEKSRASSSDIGAYQF